MKENLGSQESLMCIRSTIFWRERKLVRNHEIQRIFEIADDSLQGVLGYHYYVMAINACANAIEISEYLPSISGQEAIPHTFTWIRFYRKKDLINTFRPPFFEYYQSRISLTAMISVFEDALEKFMIQLKSAGHHLLVDGKKSKR